MALKFPDILQHNNPNKSLADITQLRGTTYPIGQLSETGSIPIDKRKIGQIIFVSGSQQFYGYYGQTTSSADWNDSANWQSLAAGATVNTGSLLITASFNLDTITFTKGDGTQFGLKIATGSISYTASVSSFQIATGSVTASVSNNTPNSIFLIKNQNKILFNVNETGSIVASGSLTLETSGSHSNLLNVKNNGTEYLKVNSEGVLILNQFTSSPNPVAGGIYLDSNGSFFYGF